MLNNYIKLLKFVKPYLFLLSIILTLLIIILLISLVPPLITKILIDKVIFQHDPKLLNILIIGLIIVFGIGLLLDFLQDYLCSVTVSKLNFDIWSSLFEHILRLPMKFHSFNRAGELIYRLFSDTNSIQRWLSTNIIHILVNVVSFLAVGAIMFIMNYKLSCILFSILVFYILTIIFFRKPIINYSRKMKEEKQNLHGNTVEYFSGIKELKAYSIEKTILEEFNYTLSKIIKLGIKDRVIKKISSSVVSFVNNCWYLIIMWYGGLQVINKEISLGNLMAFLILGNRVYSPLTKLTNLVLSFNADKVAIDRVLEIFNVESESGNNGKNKKIAPIRGDILFDSVSFGYGLKEPILTNINLNIRAGETIALAGRSGVGKTTICNLIARFYMPEIGTIYLDNHNLNNIPLDLYRKQIAVASQEPFIFSKTIRENIAFGLNAYMDDIIEAAKKANIHRDIVKLHKGYYTKVGERGVRLSGGERQRIAIARAFLRNPRILILDEATSFVDLESELLIQESLKQLMEGRTTIIIAHRLSTIMNADKIIVLENGQIVEEGKHDELVNGDGLYERLYSRMARI